VTADEYVRRVNYWLTDLPWHTKKELLLELRGHLAELPADTDLGTLGSPEQYAADLRAAAGLERRRGAIAFLRARRPLTVILVVLALTVTGLGLGMLAWVQSYQPLVLGNGYLYPADAKATAGLESQSVVFHEGRPFQFGITVANTGRFTVRVADAPLSPDLPFSGRLMMSRPLQNSGIHGPYVRFRPFDLKPGQERLLLFKGVFACRVRGVTPAVALTDFPVRFDFLWRKVTVDLSLPAELAIVFPKNLPCR
jgi:hypothetical protein